MAKDTTLRVRVDTKLAEALKKKHPRTAASVIRGLIQMYLSGKIGKVQYTETQSY